jgi:hypothetical protein
MSVRSGAPTRPPPIAGNDVDEDDIHPPEQFLLRDALSTYFGCTVGRQVPTPGNHALATNQTRTARRSPPGV